MAAQRGAGDGDLVATWKRDLATISMRAPRRIAVTPHSLIAAAPQSIHPQAHELTLDAALAELQRGGALKSERARARAGLQELWRGCLQAGAANEQARAAAVARP